MKMSSKQWIYGCVLVLAGATAAHATTFFVDAGQGNDSNAGTSAAAPFRTIQRAIGAAASLPGSDMIRIAEGGYEENVTINDADGLTLSGESGVVIVAANGLSEAIKISGGEVSLSSLAITGGSRGITAAGSAALRLRDVLVTANAGDGVRATNVMDVGISQCTFFENGLTAVRVQTADSLTVSGCTFEANGERGVRVADVKSVSVSHCHFLNNNDDGIKAVTTLALDRTQASISVSDTTISGCGDDGIDLEAIGDIRLTNLTIDDNTDDGVAIDNAVSVSVVGGTYSYNPGDGLDMDDTQSIRLVDVTSTGNTSSGFQITAENDFNVESVSIVNSEFSNNRLDGIRILEESTIVERVSLTSVTANNNGQSGLDIVITGTVGTHAVTSEGNGQPDVLP